LSAICEISESDQGLRWAKEDALPNKDTRCFCKEIGTFLSVKNNNELVRAN